MKQCIIFSLLVLILTCNYSFSQKISSQKGLTTAVFTNSGGMVKIYLPDDIRPGDIISGSIMLSPAGNTARQKQKAMEALLKTKLKIGNLSDPALVARQLTKLYPDKINSLERINVSFPFSVSITDDQNKTTSAAILQAVTQKNSSAPGCSFPTHALTGSPIRITGSFDGDASNTSCELDNRPMEIIAESPRQCIVQYPGTAANNPILSVQENKQAKCTQQINTVNMSIIAGKLNLLKGEKTSLDVQVNGLQGLMQPATLTIENQTKEVIVLEGGDQQVLVFAPGVTDSIFRKQLNVQSIKSGTFSVNFNLELPDNGSLVFADIKDAKGGKRDEKLLTADTRTALEIGWKKVHDAEETKNGEGWDCPNCFQCIKTRTTESNAGQVSDLGWGIITSFLSQGVGKMGGILDKVKEVADKAGDIYKAIKDLIDKAEIQVVGFKEDWCKNNEYCKVEGMIIYNVKTGCVEAVYKCTGTKMCCSTGLTYFKVSYCMDKDGAVISDTVSMSISH